MSQNSEKTPRLSARLRKGLTLGLAATLFLIIGLVTLLGFLDEIGF